MQVILYRWRGILFEINCKLMMYIQYCWSNSSGFVGLPDTRMPEEGKGLPVPISRIIESFYYYYLYILKMESNNSLPLWKSVILIYSQVFDIFIIIYFIFIRRAFSRYHSDSLLFLYFSDRCITNGHGSVRPIKTWIVLINILLFFIG
jgi:hypothetical protein